MGRDSDCRQAFEDQTFWGRRAHARGFRLHTDAGRTWRRPASEQVILPYPAAAPFLNSAGRAGVASVLADLK